MVLIIINVFLAKTILIEYIINKIINAIAKIIFMKFQIKLFVKNVIVNYIFVN